MKKFLTTLLCGVMVLSMAACGNTVDNDDAIYNINIDDIPTAPTETTTATTPEHTITDATPETSVDTEMGMPRDTAFIPVWEKDDTLVLQAPMFDPDRENGVIYSVSNERYDAFRTIPVVMDMLDKSNTENTVLSNTSLNMALSMLMYGSYSNSNTMWEIMMLTNGHQYTDWATENYIDYSNVPQVQIANSVWANNDITLNPAYIDFVQNHHNATASTLDFRDANSAPTINNWVADNTNDKITEIVTPDILNNSEVILINALYFNDVWQTPFTNVTTDTFTNADGSTCEVEMMCETSDDLVYYENNDCVAFSKPYENTQFSFIGILPNDDNFTVSDLDIADLLNTRRTSYTVKIGLPKFTVEDDNSLFDVLKQTYLPCTLAEDNTDLAFTDSPIVISDILQRTYIDVNEEGTEAAAATAIIATKGAAPSNRTVREVYLNRPFVFIIWDNVNNECLFIGRINTLN